MKMRSGMAAVIVCLWIPLALAGCSLQAGEKSGEEQFVETTDTDAPEGGSQTENNNVESGTEPPVRSAPPEGSVVIEPQQGIERYVTPVQKKETRKTVCIYSIEISGPDHEDAGIQKFTVQTEIPPDRIRSKIESRDINFDGCTDLLINQSEAAGGAVSVFLWDQEKQEFTPWFYSGLLADYRLYPAEGVIYNRVDLSDGEMQELYRPSGDRLTLLRVFKTAADEDLAGEGGYVFYSADSKKKTASTDKEELYQRFRAELTNTELELEIPDQPDWEGARRRTNVVRGLDAVLVIEDQTEYGFRYSINASYYSHTGILEGIAYFLPGGGAYAEQNIWGWNDLQNSERAILSFQIGEDRTVTIDCPSEGAGIGAGAGVTVNGLYTPEEPVYTNADVVNDHFTEKQLLEIKELLGDEVFEEYFLFPLEYGVLALDEETGGNVPGRLWEVFFPTMGGYEFRLLFGENRYWYFANRSTGLVTNDPNRAEPDSLSDYWPH